MAGLASPTAGNGPLACWYR